MEVLLFLALIVIAVVCFSIGIKTFKGKNGVRLQYIQGYNELKENEKYSLMINKGNINFVSFTEGFNKDVGFPKIAIKNIKSTDIHMEIKQTEENKSVVGRAVVGGLILGPIGAVVGGISGLQKTLKEEKELYFIIKDKNDEDIVFKTLDEKGQGLVLQGFENNLKAMLQN